MWNKQSKPAWGFKTLKKNAMPQKTKVFLLCAGLGRINRGYESFTRECFDALVGKPELDLTLFKGGGQSEGRQVKLRCLPRSTRLAAWLGGKLKKDAYWVEQLTFTLSLLPHIRRSRPDVIYYSDSTVGYLLWYWRRLTRRRFALLLSNGGPLFPPFRRCDLVQQLAPNHLEAALKAGQPAETQELLPYGIQMEPDRTPLPPGESAALRASLGLPQDRAIVLSVGAVNKWHKRMDYVVREVAALPEPKPYLVLLGQQDEETPEVRTLAEALLGADNYQIRTVAYQEVARYYQAAGIFVLASLAEGFGRVFLEALSWGLPCLAHDCEITRYVLGASGRRADFEQPGSLTGLLREALAEGDDPAAWQRRRRDAFQRFSWQQLGPQYVAMIQKCSALA